MPAPTHPIFFALCGKKGYNTNMNYDELISRLNTFESADERIKALMLYLLKNVQYDYVTLEKAKAQKTSITFEQIGEAHDRFQPFH